MAGYDDTFKNKIWEHVFGSNETENKKTLEAEWHYYHSYWFHGSHNEYDGKIVGYILKNYIDNILCDTKKFAPDTTFETLNKLCGGTLAKFKKTFKKKGKEISGLNFIPEINHISIKAHAVYDPKEKFYASYSGCNEKTIGLFFENNDDLINCENTTNTCKVMYNVNGGT